MPHFQTYDIVRWLHFASFAIAGGAAVVALLISGLEEVREEFRGLAAMLWKKVVAWGFRLAVLLGILLLVMRLSRGDHPFSEHYLLLKLVLVTLLLVMSELAPKPLAAAKRGAPLIAVLMFLLATFVVMNRNAFGRELASMPPPAEVSASPAS
jgi:hypothetical protein